MNPVSFDDLTSVTTASLLTHCHEGISWTGTRTTWDGKPGEGHQHTVTTYRCACGAELKVALTTPC
ncbi:hypothetical protein [uncultured Jatrophihabitans sp.]|uniref:hypothetical protein n=1 Tax=uncultured Jatrophihabitans sp. TaxID=1610747 RepID=UPI0035CC2BDE